MKLREVTNIDSHILWLAEDLFLDSDWPVRFAFRLLYTDYWSKEWARDNGPYHVEVLAVAPKAPSKAELAASLRTLGTTVEEFRASAPEAQAEILIDCGLSVCLYDQTGRNKAKLLRLARSKLPEIEMLFGFWMDRPVNMMGNTGWDAIRGRSGYRPGSKG